MDFALTCVVGRMTFATRFLRLLTSQECLLKLNQAVQLKCTLTYNRSGRDETLTTDSDITALIRYARAEQKQSREVTVHVKVQRASFPVPVIPTRQPTLNWADVVTRTHPGSLLTG